MTTALTAREFNRDVSAAKRAASNGPVIVTDRGSASHVLLGIEDYRRLTRLAGEEFLERMSMEEDIDVEFEPVSLGMQAPEL